ncbi:MAG TPA: hypothetical protein VIL48_03435 [Acidimicrobiales bacterium]
MPAFGESGVPAFGESGVPPSGQTGAPSSGESGVPPSGQTGAPSSGDAPLRPADEALLAALADALAGADAVPDGWEREAETAGDWLALDAAPADLAHDSIDDHRPAGTTAGEGSERRRLRYDAAGVTVEVELRMAAGALRLAGRVRPAARCPVRALQPGGGAHATEAGDAGTFHLDDLPAAPVSLVVEGDTPVKTGWIVP